MSMQPKGVQSGTSEQSRNQDDVLIEEGEMVFKSLIAIIVGAFGAFALILLASILGFSDFLVAL